MSFRAIMPARQWLEALGLLSWGDPSISDIVRMLRLAQTTYERSARHHEEYAALAHKRAAEARALLAELGEGPKP